MNGEMHRLLAARQARSDFRDGKSLTANPHLPQNHDLARTYLLAFIDESIKWADENGIAQPILNGW